MEFHTLTNTIFSLEKMVKSEGQQEQLLILLHKLSKQIVSFSRTHQSTIQQNKQSQKESKQLRKRLKKTTGKLEKKEEECQQIRRELVSTKDIYEHKMQKLLKNREEGRCQEYPRPQRTRERRVSRAKKERDVQCQIQNGSLVKELQERNLCLLRKINKIEKELEEERNENNSKQLYIQSLIIALESQVEKDLQEEEEEAEIASGEAISSCQDINDNSTIDADSLKGEDRQCEFFPEGEKKVWHEAQTESNDHSNERWYNPFLKVFKSATSLIWRAQ